MKKLFILVSILLFPTLYVHANMWSFSSDFVDDATGAGRDASANTEPKFLMAPIVNGKPIYYELHTDKPQNTEKYKEMIPEFFNTWFTGTLDQIKQKKRTHEFTDIISILESGANLHQAQGKQKAHIIFHFLVLEDMQQECGGPAGGCIFTDQSPLLVYLPSDQDWALRVGTHEIGHALGLADQYLEQRSNYSDTIFHSSAAQDSIMYSSRNGVSCDDATGIINAIDLVRGSSNGRAWKGLCKKDKNIYKDGAPDKDGYRINLRNFKDVLIEKYQNGKSVKSKVYTFDSSHDATTAFAHYIPQNIDKTDKHKRPIQATTADGEKIYYAYVYHGQIELVIKNGKVKQFSKNFYIPYNNNAYSPETARKYERMTFSMINGELCRLNGVIFADKSRQVQLLKGVDINGPHPTGYSFAFKENIFHKFDKKGKAVEAVSYTTDTAKAPLPPHSQSNQINPPDNDELGTHIQQSVSKADEQSIPEQMDEWVKHLKDFFD